MDDRRTTERVRAGFQAEVSRADTGALVGHLADISAGGLMLRAEQPLPDGEILPLRIELPRGSGTEPYVELTARVCWSQPDLDPAVHAVGLEFVAEPEPDRATMARLRRLLGDSR
jgi:hypothetical protein